MLQLVVFKCWNLSAGKCEEPGIGTQHDDGDHCGVSPSVSTVLSQSDDNNHGTAEDSECRPETHNDSDDLEENRSTAEAAEIFAPTSLPAVSDQFDSPSGNEDANITSSEKNP